MKKHRLLEKLAHLFRPAKKDEDGEQPTSMVLLLRKADWPSETALRSGAERAWGVSFAGGDGARHFVVSSPAANFIKVGRHLVNVVAGTLPYLGLEDWQLETFLPEADRQRAWRAHHGWWAIDYWSEDTDEDTKYCILAKLAAALLDENCTGIWIPKLQAFVPANEAAAALQGFLQLVSVDIS